MPQLPFSCLLVMQVAASEETVPGCDEYSGCPAATAAKVVRKNINAGCIYSLSD